MLGQFLRLMHVAPSYFRRRWAAVLAAGFALGLATAGYAQIIYALNGLNNSPSITPSVGTYNATTGAVINASFITADLNNPFSLAVAGPNLFVTNLGNNSIAKYDANTGSTTSATFISGLNGPYGVAVAGSDLFVTNLNTNTIGKFNADTGAPINSAFIDSSQGLNQPMNLWVDAGYLYVANYGNSTIGKYDATTGATISSTFIPGGALSNVVELVVAGNSLFIANHGGSGYISKFDLGTGLLNKYFIPTSGLSDPYGVAVLGTTLFVASRGTGNNGFIGEYDVGTGQAINSQFITGLPLPISLAAAVPEPSTYAALTGLAALGATALRRRRGSTRGALRRENR